MAELVAGLAVASSVAQLAALGYKAVNRIHEYQATARDAPRIFREIATQLPQVLQICSSIQDKGSTLSSSAAFSEVVKGCIQHVSDLDTLIAGVLPKKDDSAVVRARKAVSSIRLEKKLLDLSRILESYKSALALEFGHQTITTVRSHSPGPAEQSTAVYHYFPSSQVSRFVGREKLLERIAEVHSPSTVKPGQPRVAILIGMGGQGKTQLALEYCRRSQRSGSYNSILWINASSKVSISRSFEEIADRMTKGKRSFKDVNTCVEFVKDAVQGLTKQSLIVFDNFDTPSRMKNIAGYFPRSTDSRIVFTTRNCDASRLGTAVHVPPMEEEEAVQLLLYHIQRSGEDGNVLVAKTIVNKLGFLPLAIDQAVAYIKARNLALDAFVMNYEQRKEHVMKHTPELWDYRKQLNDEEEEISLSVFSTWELSFREISPDIAERSAVAHLLTLSGFLSNINISGNIFKAYFKAHDPKPEWMSIFVSDEEFDDLKYEVQTQLLHYLPVSVPFLGSSLEIYMIGR